MNHYACMLPYMDPEAGAVVELLWALLAGEAPLSGVEGVAVRLQVGLEGEAPKAEAALVSLRATDRLGILRVLAAFRTLWHLIEGCKSDTRGRDCSAAPALFCDILMDIPPRSKHQLRPRLRTRKLKNQQITQEAETWCYVLS